MAHHHGQDPQPSSPHFRPWLHGFAVAMVTCTFILVALGGTVTSKGAGLAVPDWPTTFQYNMFLFPPSLWQGGIFWEHTHRLMGSLVGLLSIILAVWLWITQKHRPWLRWMGLAVLALVIVQGVMGGLRVTELSITLAILHGITGQLFLATTILVASATGPLWTRRYQEMHASTEPAADPTLQKARRWSAVLIAALVIQLALGAAMRHTGSGLAIPDFPASYGSLLPPLSDDGIQEAMNQYVPYDQLHQYYHPAQIGVHFAHRVWALAVLAVAGYVAVELSRRRPGEPTLVGPLGALAFLLLAQIALGASVIWTARHPEVATAHQVTGAAILAAAVILSARVYLLPPSADGATKARRLPTGLDSSGPAIPAQGI